MTDLMPSARAGEEPASGSSPAPLIVAEALTRDFGRGHVQVRALRGVDLRIGAAQLVAVRGRSGSGKTTLLNILGGLDLPTSGSIRVAGVDLAAVGEHRRVMMRRSTIGFVFQTFGLIPFLTATENVSLPLRIARARTAERDERVRRVLDLVGLADRAGHRPTELSGGQQQRVAIARALAQSPRLLIADEPTGHLDARSAERILVLLREIAETEGTTVVVATHDERVARIAHATFDLHDGRIAAA